MKETDIGKDNIEREKETDFEKDNQRGRERKRERDIGIAR